MSTRPRFWLRAVLALVLLLAVAAAFGWQRWRHWTPARTDYPMQGLALSAVHGVVDWGSLQTQNPDFVYVRAVNGQHGRDPAFSRNWAEAKAAGMRYGAEILFDPCFPASAQATVFVTTVPRDNAALPAAIRIDDAPACAALPGRDRVVSELNTLINLVEAHMGKPTLLHLSQAAEQRYAISESINRTLWLDRAWFAPHYASHPWVMWTANPARQVAGVQMPVEWIVVAK
ncbi:MAG: glycoside hydrolase family 25 [Sphingobium sp.]|jgi:lysozyme|nr:glycoside hydrolase family 25 [Sphingobium sp.]MCI1272721.1 glycoside hydrolase family 25 [Sphingobium sp.]MCI1755045.1 glycoside hydrolase family 25 [Sphingobium sp.]MCI2053683.1 glycoside hydrolase family 25 [Sphingobium sp.]